jgi:hypothetical protein
MRGGLLRCRKGAAASLAADGDRAPVLPDDHTDANP